MKSRKFYQAATKPKTPFRCPLNTKPSAVPFTPTIIVYPKSRLIKLLCAFAKHSSKRDRAVHIWWEVRTFQCEECWPDSEEMSYKRFSVSSHIESVLFGNDVRDIRTYEVGTTLLPMSECDNHGKHKTHISYTNNRDSGNNSNHTNYCNYTSAVRTFR
jgi:hypothetical protein